MPKSERTAHPTQKPIGLIETIIKRYSGPDAIVFDPFCGGSGQIVEVLGRHWLAAELSREYCEIIVRRLNGK